MAILVLPKWDCRNVKDWHELIVRTADGEEHLKGAIAVLLNYMPLIGVTTLTEENAGDCWRRIAIREALLGGMALADRTDRPMFLTRSDIERHIGAETEGAALSFQEFCV